MTTNNRTVAQKLKLLLIDSSALIEEYTAEVCPNCIDICCRQKHGVYQEKDILYLRALGDTVPTRDQGKSLEGSCEVMGPQGCTQPRWMRPFKCTWYFCEPLLKALSEGPPRNARRVSGMLQEMADLYDKLGKE